MHILFRILTFLVIGCLLAAGAFYILARNERTSEVYYLSALKKNLILSSSSFPPDGDMPVSCSCRGKQLTPALRWENPDSTVKSFVLITTDSDVPTPAFRLYNLSHWVVYNLPATLRSLPEGVTAEQLRMLGGKVGKNGTGRMGYIGPCPPLGRHAYVVRVYALDRMLSFTNLPGKQALLDGMKGHVLGYGELTGYFQ